MPTVQAPIFFRIAFGVVIATGLSLSDPGEFINETDDSDGRVGFGATLSISPDGRFVFVAGETSVGVNFEDRVFVSVDGGEFLIVEDADDPLVAQRAAGVAASNNLVAFLIPANPRDEFDSQVTIGYATLPPPE